MRSHAALSSNRPPSTDCSASIECGGTFSDSSWGSFDGAFMETNYRANAVIRKPERRNKKKREPVARLPFFARNDLANTARYLDVFAQHRHRHIDENVGVQRNLHRMIADRFQRAFRKTHLRLFHCEALLDQCVGDVGVRHRAEQTAVDASLLANLNGRAGHLFALSLSGCQLFSSDLFQFCTADFEFSDRFLRCTASLLFRDQEVTCVTVLHLDDVPEIAQVDDFFEKNDLHSDAPCCVVGLGLVLVGVRHEREKTCALDCRIQLALIMRLRTRKTRRRDLAVFADEVLQRFEVLVVDLVDASGRETAELLALEERILLLTTLVEFLTSRAGHVQSFPMSCNSVM